MSVVVNTGERQMIREGAKVLHYCGRYVADWARERGVYTHQERGVVTT